MPPRAQHQCVRTGIMSTALLLNQLERELTINTVQYRKISSDGSFLEELVAAILEGPLSPELSLTDTIPTLAISMISTDANLQSFGYDRPWDSCVRRKSNSRCWVCILRMALRKFAFMSCTNDGFVTILEPTRQERAHNVGDSVLIASRGHSSPRSGSQGIPKDSSGLIL